MERANIRYANTNENSDALKHKVSRVSQNQPIQTTRSALSDVSTSHNALRARPGLDKPAQRVQVYKETDENDVPKPVSKYEAPDHNRQPLAEIQTRQTPYAAENSYIEESSFVEEDDDEEEAEAMPQPMMPILSFMRCTVSFIAISWTLLTRIPLMFLWLQNMHQRSLIIFTSWK